MSPLPPPDVVDPYPDAVDQRFLFASISIRTARFKGKLALSKVLYDEKQA
jgi:hypothetical protein